jgi:6-phosphogluconate dehydrogenase
MESKIGVVGLGIMGHNLALNMERNGFPVVGDDPYRVAEMFEAVKASHDTYKIKAWLDTAPSNMPAKRLKTDNNNANPLIR